MVKRSRWCAFLSVLLLVVGAGSVRAVEYGEMVQTKRKVGVSEHGRPCAQTHAHEGVDHEREIPTKFQHKREKTGSNPPMRSSIYGENSNGPDM